MFRKSELRKSNNALADPSVNEFYEEEKILSVGIFQTSDFKWQ